MVEGEGRLGGDRGRPSACGSATTCSSPRRSCWPADRHRSRCPACEVDGARVLTSEHALRLETLPARAVVLGGGVIGVEFASAWRSFGRRGDRRRGTPPAAGRARSPEISAAAASGRSASAASTLRTGVAGRGGARHRRRRAGCGWPTAPRSSADLLLVAVGRGPVSEDLGYRRPGSASTAASSVTDERLPDLRARRVRRRRPGRRPPARPSRLRPRASSSPRRSPIGPAALDRPPVPVRDRDLARVTYSDPEVASVGPERAGRPRGVRRDRDARPTTSAGNGKSQILKTAGLRQAGPPGRRTGGRCPPRRGPGRRADRGGPADHRLGGLSRRRGRALPRPSRPRPRRSARPISRWPASPCTPTDEAGVQARCGA